MRPLDGARENALAGRPGRAWLASSSRCGRSWKGQIALKSTSAHLQPDSLGDQQVALIAVGGDTQTLSQRLETARPFQTCPVTHRQVTRTPLSDIALATSDRQVGCLGCTLYCATPSQSPRAAHPRAHTHTHTLALPPFTVSASCQQHNGPGQSRCGAPSHHTRTCQRAPCPRKISPF